MTRRPPDQPWEPQASDTQPIPLPGTETFETKVEPTLPPWAHKVFEIVAYGGIALLVAVLFIMVAILGLKGAIALWNI